MTNALAWTAQQVFRVAELPGELPRELRRGGAYRSLAAVIDRTWRNRVELCRRTGLSQSSVGRLLKHMTERGEVEVLPARGPRAAQFRRAL